MDPRVAILCVLFVSETLACESGSNHACTKENNPVCGTFSYTFANQCVMESQLCKLAKQGFHFEGSRSKICCWGSTPLVFQTICASNGKTYSNKYQLNYWNCVNRDYYTVADPSTCPNFPKKLLRSKENAA